MTIMRGVVVDASGRPSPGVAVSDGVTVTTTNTAGAFSIEPVGRFVFVCRPSGSTCAEWFVRPDGSDVTFVLTREPAPSPYQFVHISDPHLATDRSLAMRPVPPSVELGNRDAFTQFLTTLPERAPAASAVVVTGDLTNRGRDDEYAALRSSVVASPLPVHLLPGNHDHMTDNATAVVSRNNYLINGGDPAAYERHIGPRWYSFDLPGLHVVALDWHTHEIGLDHEIQDAWIQADLESVPGDRPWILLSHDQPSASILSGLPRPPIATFSGHRHTSRVVEINGTLHVNTPTPLFAGLDYSPPSFRVVSWDGEQFSMRTQAIARTGLERATFTMPSIELAATSASRPSKRTSTPSRWQHQLPGGGHLAPVRVAGDLVLAPVKVEDRSAGGVDAIALTDGSLRWRADLGSAVKATPAVHGDRVFAVAVSGDLFCLGLDDGCERWKIPSPDPLRLFAFAAPAVVGDVVVVGDMSHLRAHDVATGALRWERTDLGPYQTFVAHSAPLAVGDTVVAGAYPSPSTMVSLDAATGSTRWPSEQPSDADQAPEPAAPVGTPLHDQRYGAIYLPAPSRLVKIEATTGTVVWSAATSLLFNPATPVATPDGIATVDGTELVLYDRDSGTRRWRAQVETTAPLAMNSYTRTPRSLFARPTLVDDLLLAPGLDGYLHAVDAKTGDQVGRLDVGVPVAAPVVAADDLLLAVGVDGNVIALNRHGLP